MQRCGAIYVSGGSLTLRYRDKGNLLINGRRRKDYGDAPGELDAIVKIMEMYLGRRPVKGGPTHPDAVVKVMEMQVGPRPVYGGPGSPTPS